MEESPPPPPASPPEPSKKKGLHPMAWVGIGCGGLLVVAVIAMSLLVGMCNRKVAEWKEDFSKDPHKAGAEMVVRLNPDLEMVSDDETGGEMTVRVKSTGEEMTFSYEDIAQGRLTMTDGEGNTTTIGMTDPSEVPAWVPVYPRVAEQVSIFQKETNGEIEGAWVFTTNDSAEDVADHFESETSWSSGTSSGSSTIGSASKVTRRFKGGGKEITLLVTEAGDGSPTQVTVSYSGPK